MANFYWNQIRKQNINNNAFSNIVPDSGNGGSSGGNGKCWQVKTMPAANAANEGMIVEYIGKTTDDYLFGYSYECASCPAYSLYCNITKLILGGSPLSVDAITVDINETVFNQHAQFPLSLYDQIVIDIKDLGTNWRVHCNQNGNQVGVFDTQGQAQQDIEDIYNWLESYCGIHINWGSTTMAEPDLIDITMEQHQSGVTYGWRKKNVQDLVLFSSAKISDWYQYSTDEYTTKIHVYYEDMRKDDEFVSMIPDLFTMNTKQVGSWNKGSINVKNVYYDENEEAWYAEIYCDATSVPPDVLNGIFIFKRTVSE